MVNDVKLLISTKERTTPLIFVQVQQVCGIAVVPNVCSGGIMFVSLGICTNTDIAGMLALK